MFNKPLHDAVNSENSEQEAEQGDGDKNKKQDSTGDRNQNEQQSSAGPKEYDDGKQGADEKNKQEQRSGPEGYMQRHGGPGKDKLDDMELQDSAGLMEAVEEFDQLGEQQRDDEARDNTHIREPGGTQGNSYMMLVEQQLDAIEGDPAQLLHNRFKLEEQRRQQPQRSGARIYEPRPW